MFDASPTPEKTFPNACADLKKVLRIVGGGGTELHLVHCGLTDQMADAHNGGWVNYLARLSAVAEGRDPGPDALADERVQSAGAHGPHE